ncbi:helix-turn-helix domain-containing protein [Ruthenibacterium lactatiformans]|uniref:helix-turn-helix domain-containing protein n=1 Tax=Ruthenibacterium lactatiformans TaxID=1550024 RepID=UPI001FA77AC2|nr:helix-turn-helix transcriptional regulator [Ruthenibacterium lactatiformans]
MRIRSSSFEKKRGWSQEELAEKLNVTRQSVSKWEGAQSIPDLEKILQLAQIFGVSTDYLLKDELAEAEYTKSDDSSSVRRVSMEEANAFLQVKQATAGRIAFATFFMHPLPHLPVPVGCRQRDGHAAHP